MRVIAANMMNKYPNKKSFFIDLTVTQIDKNLKIVIEIQNMELYLVAYSLVAIP